MVKVLTTNLLKKMVVGLPGYGKVESPLKTDGTRKGSSFLVGPSTTFQRRFLSNFGGCNCMKNRGGLNHPEMAFQQRCPNFSLNTSVPLWCCIYLFAISTCKNILAPVKVELIFPPKKMKHFHKKTPAERVSYLGQPHPRKLTTLIPLTQIT